MTKVANSEPTARASVAALVSGDLLALFAFGVIGRATHDLATSNISGVLTTTIPFVAGWFLVSPWFGLFKPAVVTAPAKVVTRTLLAWVPLGFPISMVLWALLRRRSIPDGIVPEFAIAALAATVIFLVAWRLIYAMIHRSR